MIKLFISYARNDQGTVQAIVDELRYLGFDVWIDTNRIYAGQLFSTSISQAIADCDFFLLIVSLSSMKSDYVRREVDVAHSKEKTIIPIRLDNVDIPNEFDLQLAGIHWLEYKDLEWMKKFLAALANFRPIDVSLPDNKDKQDEQLDPSIKDNPKILNPLLEELSDIVEFFSSDYVLPEECDKSIATLDSLNRSLSFKPRKSYLKPTYHNRITEIIDQIKAYREICDKIADQTESSKKNILAKLKRLHHDLNRLR